MISCVELLDLQVLTGTTIALFSDLLYIAVRMAMSLRYSIGKCLVMLSTIGRHYVCPVIIQSLITLQKTMTTTTYFKTQRIPFNYKRVLLGHKTKSLINKILLIAFVVNVVLLVAIYAELFMVPKAKFSISTNPTIQTVSLGSSLNAFTNQLKSSNLSSVVLASTDVNQDSLSIPGKMVLVDGDNIEVFEYADSETALKEASIMSQKFEASPRTPEWKSKIHLYVNKNLLIFYMGEKDSIISALNQGTTKEVSSGGQADTAARYLSVVSKSGNYYK